MIYTVALHESVADPASLLCVFYLHHFYWTEASNTSLSVVCAGLSQEVQRRQATSTSFPLVGPPQP